MKISHSLVQADPEDWIVVYTDHFRGVVAFQLQSMPRMVDGVEMPSGVVEIRVSLDQWKKGLADLPLHEMGKPSS